MLSVLSCQVDFSLPVSCPEDRQFIFSSLLSRLKCCVHVYKAADIWPRAICHMDLWIASSEIRQEQAFKWLIDSVMLLLPPFSLKAAFQAAFVGAKQVPHGMDACVQWKRNVKGKKGKRFCECQKATLIWLFSILGHWIESKEKNYKNEAHMHPTIRKSKL